MSADLDSVCQNFQLQGRFVGAEPFGSGHINDTYRVAVERGGAQRRFIIQRINHAIFRDPPRLMENIRQVTGHLQSRLSGCADAPRRALGLVLSTDGEAFYRDDHGAYWRCFHCIEDASTFDTARDAGQVFQAARAFGRFQSEVYDFPPERLHQTIPDFHNTPKRYMRFLDLLEADPCNRAAAVGPEIEFALHREAMTHRLLDLHDRGEIPGRITHNDTKLNNVLLDDETGEGLCVIDLDTVMPGLSLYDFGDLVRTCVSPAAEDERDLSRIVVQMHMFEALVRGYLSGAGDLLNATEKTHLSFSGQLLAFENGLRFLTDYLQGDVYFKVHREDHNLDRCRSQFRLTAAIEDRRDAMDEKVASLAY